LILSKQIQKKKIRKGDEIEKVEMAKSTIVYRGREIRVPLFSSQMRWPPPYYTLWRAYCILREKCYLSYCYMIII
jgi:hypothetical protein